MDFEFVFSMYRGLVVGDLEHAWNLIVGGVQLHHICWL